MLKGIFGRGEKNGGRERTHIPVIAEEVPDASCSNCVGACCLQGTILELNPDEVNFLREHGTELEPYALPRKMGTVAGYGLYRSRSDCGLLAQDSELGAVCTAYEDPDRPGVCASFTPGSLACRTIREKKGVDPVGSVQAFVVADNV